MKQIVGFGDSASAVVTKACREEASMKSNCGARFGGTFHVICRRPDGSIRWEDDAKNLVVKAGLNKILDDLFTGATQVNPWYVGLTAATPVPDAEDTMGSHGGWTLFTNFDEATRQTYADVRTNQAVSNTLSPAVFNISTNGSSIGGAFLTSDNGKSGTTGTLLCCAAFSGGNKAADDGDTLQVTYTFSAADDGV